MARLRFNPVYPGLALQFVLFGLSFLCLVGASVSGSFLWVFIGLGFLLVSALWNVGVATYWLRRERGERA